MHSLANVSTGATGSSEVLSEKSASQAVIRADHHIPGGKSLENHGLGKHSDRGVGGGNRRASSDFTQYQDGKGVS